MKGILLFVQEFESLIPDILDYQNRLVFEHQFLDMLGCLMFVLDILDFQILMESVLQLEHLDMLDLPDFV